MDVWEVTCSSCSGLDKDSLMDVGPTRNPAGTAGSRRDRPRQVANRRPAGHAVGLVPAERPEVHRPQQVSQWTTFVLLGTLRHHAGLAAAVVVVAEVVGERPREPNALVEPG